jgi:hypothetical protein
VVSWGRESGNISKSLTLATVGDILRYIRYIAGEALKDIETSRFFFRIYMGHFSGRGASLSSGTTIVVEPITINVEKSCPKANPFDVC